MTETSTGTNVPVTDEMVETAARAMWERIDREESWSEIYHASAYRRDARAALEAVAPAIAAAAWDEGYAAAQLEWKHVYDGHPIDPDVDDQMCTECGKGIPYA